MTMYYHDVYLTIMDMLCIQNLFNSIDIMKLSNCDEL